MNKIRKYDTLGTGLILGLLVPVLAVVILWAFNSEGSLISYIKGFHKVNSLAGLVSLSAIPNLLLFFIFIWTNWVRSARGVIYATLIVAAIMLLLKVL